MHASATDRWTDGSLRWVACDLLLDSDVPEVVLSLAPSGPATDPPIAVRLTGDAGSTRVDTGAVQVDLSAGQPFPFGSVWRAGVAVLDDRRSGLRVDLGGLDLDFTIASVVTRSDSPLRTVVMVAATARDGATCPLQVEARLEFFAGSPVVRAEIVLRNPSPADHPGGCWVLGDRGSLHLRSAVCSLVPAGGVGRLRGALEAGRPFEAVPPFAVHQESSGGSHWDSRVHCNSQAQVTLRYPGYRVRMNGEERRGDRATPVLTAESDIGPISIAVPDFWQRFPQALLAESGVVSLAMFPADVAEPHELQGGEQSTHACCVAFGEDPVSADALDWVLAPTLLGVDPAWVALTGAVPFLTPQSVDRSPGYVRLVESGLDPAQGFFAKREEADEFGWRHFGDLPADHESAFLPPGRVNVSHYNNQYDALACFAVHYLRSSDVRWHTLLCDLAAHVRDIDVYHTTGDKAAYNGGLFWHTDHYVDAATSTHRTYPTGTHGGGPSNEHNYNLGLLYHYLLTGDERSRDTAIGLGQWVLDMEDGSRTPFRWLCGGATGLASNTGSPTYHGPGRGAANSILACLVAHRLTGESRFAEKADELVRRCIHPADDLAARQLDDTERRWYYTVFLQALGHYLLARWERGQFDAMFAYAQASLRLYARYIADVERPYLDTPERLQYPTETWVAQDLRKGDALLWASFFAVDAAERQQFLSASDRFFDYAVDTLLTMPTRTYTRPLVLTMGVGWARTWFATHTLPPPVAVTHDIPPMPPPFVPQKIVALRRARLLAGAAVAAVVTAVIVAVVLHFLRT